MRYLDLVPPAFRRADTDGNARTGPIWGVVAHTTGSGIVQRAFDRGCKTSLEVSRFAVDYYAARGNDVSTHFLVGWDGEIWQLVDLDREAWHAGWGPQFTALYRSVKPREWTEWAQPVNSPLVHRSPAGGYAAWFARWPGLNGPAELIPAGYSSPNKGTVSVDFLAMPNGRAPTPAQLQAGTVLLATLSMELAIPVTRRNFLCHSDLDPVRRACLLRGTKIVESAWDPPAQLDPYYLLQAAP